MKRVYILMIGCLLMASCKKLVETNPPGSQLTQATVFKNDGAAAAAMNYPYIKMAATSNTTSGQFSLDIMAGLSADEDSTVIPADMDFYRNDLTPRRSLAIWGEYYQLIFHVNAVIEGIQDPAISAAVRNQLMGEALFLRAFLHHYLVNFYGKVPLVTTTYAATNSKAVRAPQDTVYKQIIADLRQAKQLLGNDYYTPLWTVTTERVRPNKWAATAMLARVYLYTKQYALAEAEATELINHTAAYNLVSLDSAFLKNNRESIWQLQSIATGVDTWEGAQRILTAKPDNFKPVSMSHRLYNSFEAGDQRKIKWTGRITADGRQYPFPYKYKVMSNNSTNKSEYLVVLRLAEQYLIRAEARAWQGKIPEARADLNAIRRRAALLDVQTTDRDLLLLAIEQERRVELFAEWGHRWLDLKRTGRIDEVMSIVTAQKGGVWKSHQQWYPILETEIRANPNLEQTPGY
ncbi:MAG: RagB/SusD family nutrient uptake outer membrane protein [Niastella sp.]|nr:RagB/SusD family nutrient uptake outer membrane protein [Niastella sp.]